MLTFALLAFLAGADDKDDKITAKELAAMKKNLTGRIALDRRSGVVQIAYDFRTPKQGNDFLVKEKPADVKGGFILKPSTSATHVVPWKTVQVEAKVPIVKMVGHVMTASESKAGLQLGGDNLNTLYLVFPNQPGRLQIVVPDPERTGLRTLRMELTEEASLVAFDSYQVSEPTKLGDAGKIEFFGGTHGFGFRSIVFRGKPDPVWLKKLVEEKESRDR